MGNNYNHNHNRRYSNSQEKGSNQGAAPASKIGEPFYNPYTFIPFPNEVERRFPTPLTIDERSEERGRKTGVLELEIKTLSPLMTCDPVAISDDEGHKTYKALTIDNDVIVPASSIRGALRTLMTIISGGTLGYMDEHLWLTQGRDAQLGPNKKMPGVPNEAFLAKVKQPGDATRAGIIELGETKLMEADWLGQGLDIRIDKKRPTAGRTPLTYQDEDGSWEVKLSGRPIRRRGKKEGLFKGLGKEIELPAKFWDDYQGRYRHSVFPELEKGDLIWLEPKDVNCKEIKSASDIKSIQWARWGHHGEKLERKLPQVVIPDSMRRDGKVDRVTDLFGQIPHKDHSHAAGPFAARIRPGNLVFYDLQNRL